MKHIKELLESFKDNKRGLMTKLRYNPEIVKDINTMTNFMDENSSISERVYCLYNGITERPTCPICNIRQKRFEKMDKGYFSSCGDDECKRQIHIINNRVACNKKDHTAIYEKAKKTNKERYGVEHTQSKNSKIRKKRDDTMLRKYGSIHALQIPEFKDKYIKSMESKEDGYMNQRSKDGIIKKYGSLSVYTDKRSLLIKSMWQEWKSEKYYKILLDKIHNMGFDIIENEENKKFKLKCRICGTIISKTRDNMNLFYREEFNPCYICNPQNKFRSKFEQNVASFISKIYDKEIQFNRQYLGIEVDILLPDIKLGIECNGVYWHSEEYKDKMYHINKKKILENQGYSLIQIWDDDWNNPIKQEIIKSRLMSKLGFSERIYARKCILKEVGYKEVKSFLYDNHLHGYAPSSINIGLYYNDALVSVCTFSKSRNSLKNKGEEGYELIRNCTKKGFNVIGGFSKMIKYFSNLYSKDIYSYADCDWINSSNNGYLSSRFIFEKYTEPSYWWAKTIRENRIKFQKHKLVAEGYDASMSETEIMHSRKYHKVYGSGNLKFRYKKEESV